MSELVFRLYRPTSPELEEFYKPLSVEPVEVLSLVESVIENARRDAPDSATGLSSLTPRASCGDIKRLMSEEIDLLLDETLDALSELKKAKHDK